MITIFDKPREEKQVVRLRLDYCGDCVFLQSVASDGKLLANLLEVRPNGIYRCRFVSESAGLPLDKSGRVVEMDAE